MKKLKNKTLLGFILGLIVAGGIGVAASTIWAADITYTKEDNTKVTVQKAIDDLYKMSSSGSTGGGTGFTIEETETDEDGNLVGATYYAIVYLDPTNLSNYCDEINSQGKTAGCMKWYAYEKRVVNNKTEYDLILDHVTKKVVWNASLDNSEPKTIQPELDSLVNDTKWVLTPRLITADEVAKIAGLSNFDSGTAPARQYFIDMTTTKTDWFFNIESFWTSTPVYNTTESVWIAGKSGRNGSFRNEYTYGQYDYLRPVITITK